VQKISALLEENPEGIYDSPYGPLSINKDGLIDLCMATIACYGKDASWNHTLQLANGRTIKVSAPIVQLLFELVYNYLESLKHRQLSLPL